jgi:hypothetical protein
VSVWRHGWSGRAASGRCRLTEEVGQADSGVLVEEQTRGGVEVVGLAVGEPIDVEARAAMPPEDMIEVSFDSPSSAIMCEVRDDKVGFRFGLEMTSQVERLPVRQ